MIDHGPGIAPEAAPHVFERFWRSDPGRVRAQGGAGLGLSIVAAVADAHGGRVLLTETPGGGATFIVDLPTEPRQGPELWGGKETVRDVVASNGASVPDRESLSNGTASQMPEMPLP